jgi:prevent-host-death family protein
MAKSNDLEVVAMNALTANEAKSQFGDLLLKAQREPIQINKNGKPIAVVMSMEDYEGFEAMKLSLLQARAAQAKADIAAGKSLEGDAFFDALESGVHD